MSLTLNKKALQKLIDEDVVWLRAVSEGTRESPGLEKAHIIEILQDWAVLKEKCERLEGLKRRFPIQGGPSLPWAMIMPHENQALENHDQSFERLAQRGGLDSLEMLYVLDSKSLRGFPKYPRDEPAEAVIELKKRRVAFEGPLARAEAAEADANRKINLGGYFTDDGRVTDVVEMDDDGDPCDTAILADVLINHNNEQVTRAEEADAKIGEVGKIVSAFCVNECPVNTEEFGGELPNPQDCERGCPCLARDIWRAILNTKKVGNR